VDGTGIVGGVHNIAEISNAFRSYVHERDCHLGVVDAGRGEQGGDREIAAGDIEKAFLAAPVIGIAFAVASASEAAVGGDSLKHSFRCGHLELGFDTGLVGKTLHLGAAAAGPFWAPAYPSQLFWAPIVLGLLSFVVGLGRTPYRAWMEVESRAM